MKINLGILMPDSNTPLYPTFNAGDADVTFQFGLSVCNKDADKPISLIESQLTSPPRSNQSAGYISFLTHAVSKRTASTFNKPIAWSNAEYKIEFYEIFPPPKTLVFYVAGFYADPNEKPQAQLLSTLKTQVETLGLSQVIDIKLFPDTLANPPMSTYKVFTKRRDVVRSLINYILKLNLEYYDKVFIITHSAGYIMTKSAVLAANGKTYESHEDYVTNSEAERLKTLFKKAQIFSLAPAMGGSTVAKITPFSNYFNPATRFQKWFADNDADFQGNVLSFNSYMIIGDPMYLALWAKRKTGGDNRRSTLDILKNVGLDITQSLMWNFWAEKLERQYYDKEKSSDHQEYPVSIVPDGNNIHRWLLNYPPLINDLVQRIIATKTSIKLQIDQPRQLSKQQIKTLPSLCQENAAYLSYAYNATDNCYTKYANNLSYVLCLSDITEACNTLSYPDNDNEYSSSNNCVKDLSYSTLNRVINALSEYYACEGSLGTCSSSQTTLIGNQPYYCGPGNTWLPTKVRGESCTASSQCASNQCSSTCQGLNPIEQSPNFTFINGQSIVEGQISKFSVSPSKALQFNVSATSPVGQKLTYSVTDLPAGAKFNPVSGIFSWTPQLGQEGTFIALFTATDTTGRVGYVPIQITSGSGNNTNPSWKGSINIVNEQYLRKITWLDGTTAPCVNATGIDLNLSAVEQNGLGASFMQFSIDGSKWDSLLPYSTTKHIAPVGNNYFINIYVRFKDLVGNLSPAYSSSTIILDTTLPTGSIAITGGAKSTNSPSVQLTLSAKDNLTGVINMWLSNDQKKWTTMLYQTNVSWTLDTSSAGTKSVYIKFQDGAGNWSNITSAKINYNKLTVFACPNVPTGHTLCTGATIGLSNANLPPSSNTIVAVCPNNTGTTPCRAVCNTTNNYNWNGLSCTQCAMNQYWDASSKTCKNYICSAVLNATMCQGSEINLTANTTGKAVDTCTLQSSSAWRNCEFACNTSGGWHKNATDTICEYCNGTWNNNKCSPFSCPTALPANTLNCNNSTTSLGRNLAVFSLVNTQTNCGTTPCVAYCKTNENYYLSNDSCVKCNGTLTGTTCTATITCSKNVACGTQPTGSMTWSNATFTQNCFQNSSGVCNVDCTPATKTWVYSATNAGECSYRCASGYSWNNTVCVKCSTNQYWDDASKICKDYVCPASLPANALNCDNSSASLGSNPVSFSLVNAQSNCGTTACTAYCKTNDNYYLSSGSCIKCNGTLSGTTCITPTACSKNVLCGTPPTGSTAWGMGTFTQSCTQDNNGACNVGCSPASKNWIYASASGGECSYKCASDYNWTGTECKKCSATEYWDASNKTCKATNTRIFNCQALPNTTLNPSAYKYNTVSSYQQTCSNSDCSVRSPAESTLSMNYTSSTTSCNYVCDESRYFASGTECLPRCLPIASLPAGWSKCVSSGNPTVPTDKALIQNCSGGTQQKCEYYCDNSKKYYFANGQCILCTDNWNGNACVQCQANQYWDASSKTCKSNACNFAVGYTRNDNSCVRTTKLGVCPGLAWGYQYWNDKYTQTCSAATTETTCSTYTPVYSSNNTPNWIYSNTQSSIECSYHCDTARDYHWINTRCTTCPSNQYWNATNGKCEARILPKIPESK